MQGKLVGLAPMDRDNGKEQVKRLWIDGPHVAEKLEQALVLKDRGNGE